MVRSSLTHRRSTPRWLPIAAAATTLAALVAAPAAAVAEFALVHAFANDDNAAVPFGSVIHLDGWLYGTAAYTSSGTGNVAASGGVGGGAVYAVRPDGTGFRIVKSFATVAEGQNPFQGLTVTGSNLIGATRNGGLHGRGTLFHVNADGDGFETLHHFTGGLGGAYPYAAPILKNDILYGMTFLGGTASTGVIYSYETTTSTFSVAHSFAAVGGQPFGGLTAVGDWLYGLVSDHRLTTDYGAIFRFRPGDQTYEVVHAFEGGTQGGYPYDTLTWDGGRYLYGTTLGYYPYTGETVPLADEGVIFRYDLEAEEYAVLHDFSLAVGDGAKPNSAMLVGPNDTLYGIAHGTEIWGGPGYEYGTLYRLNTDGTNFEVMHVFDSMEDGNTPMRSLLMIGDQLYGTTAFGGTGINLGNGTVWTFAVPEPAGPVLAALGLGTLIARRSRRNRMTT